MAAARCPPQLPPACSRSFRAPWSARLADSTSAGTSRCGALGKRFAVGVTIISARTTRVAIFMVPPPGTNVGSTARESATLPAGMAIQVFAESQMRQPRALALEILQCEPRSGGLDRAVGLEVGTNAFGDKSPKALAARWLLREGWTLVATL